MFFFAIVVAGLLSEEQCKARDVRRKARQSVQRSKEETMPSPDSNTATANKKTGELTRIQSPSESNALKQNLFRMEAKERNLWCAKWEMGWWGFPRDTSRLRTRAWSSRWFRTVQCHKLKPGSLTPRILWRSHINRFGLSVSLSVSHSLSLSLSLSLCCLSVSLFLYVWICLKAHFFKRVVPKGYYRTLSVIISLYVRCLCVWILQGGLTQHGEIQPESFSGHFQHF